MVDITLKELNAANGFESVEDAARFEHAVADAAKLYDVGIQADDASRTLALTRGFSQAKIYTKLKELLHERALFERWRAD